MKEANFYLIFLLTVLMSMVGAKVSAHDIEVANADGVTIYYNWNSDKTELSVTYRGDSWSSYKNEYTGNVVIPSSVTYNGKEHNVTNISDNAFFDCDGLTSVTIGNSVEGIGNYAFNNCSYLTSVTIGNSVEHIGWSAFEDCYSLTSVEIPNSVTGIDYDAFRNCSGLTSVTIGNSVKSIGNDVFKGCSHLLKVIVKDIAAWCNIKFINEITSNPLYYAHHLYSDENTEITDLVIPNSVTSIGDYAFQDCFGLTSVTIGNSVTTIGRWVFSGCSCLTSVTIGNSVTSIGDYAFSGSGLTSVTIPNSVQSIGINAFYGCSDLISVTIDNSVIGDGEFIGCIGLTSVTIGNSVVSIGDSSFARCSSLTSITIPNSITSIGRDAFAFCYGLTSVTIGNSVIGDGEFYCCTGLTSVEIPNGVTSIGQSAFSGCSGLTSVEIPNSVTSIGVGAFNGCTGLTSVEIPNSVTSIGQVAFYCSNLKKVIVKDIAAWCNIKFGKEPLSYAHHLYSDENTEITDLVIPNSVTSIGDYAFENCTDLTSVTIPNSVTGIGLYAFWGCSSLTSVEIPNSVTSIGSYAFYNCSCLTSVTSLIKEPFDIDTYTFSDDTYKNVTLYVPAGTKEKYEATEGWRNFASIVEMDDPQDMTPIDQGETIDFGNDIDEDTNLDGNVVGNVFFNIGSGDGSYDPTEGCIIVNKATDDATIDGKDIFGKDFKDGYTGIVFKVNEGKGTIKVEAETQGNMVLKVKIGNSDPIEVELEGKLKVKFPYVVTEETLVYVYGGTSAAGAKASGARRAPSDADALKIYGIELENNDVGIDAVDAQSDSSADTPVYNLNGQRVNAPVNGVYIKNGRKVLVK